MGRLQPRHFALAVTALAFFVDTLLYCLLVPLLPRYAKELDLTQSQVGVLFWSYALALLLATFPVARLTDRYGRKAPMLWGLGGLAFATLAFAYSRSYEVLLVARVLQGVAGAATWLPGMALVADHFPKESRGSAMGTVFAGANLGLLVGPPLSGFLDHYFGPMAPFHLGIALVVLDALGRAFLLKETEALREPPIPWRVLLRNRVVLVFAGALALGSGFWTLMESALPLDFAKRLGLGPRSIGFLFGMAALTHTLSSPWMGAISDRVGRVRVLRIGLVTALFLLPLPVLMPSVWTAGLAMAALGLNLSFIVSPCSPAVADQVERLDSQSFASGFSILNIAYSIGMVMGPLVGGLLIDAFGTRWAFGIIGLGFAAYLVVTRGLQSGGIPLPEKN
ncbi:MAG: MFS transporter [Holophaga sp.]|nr:MFS transporter [Holophaga sp.]